MSEPKRKPNRRERRWAIFQAGRKEAERMAYEELCMLNKKWYAEQLRQMLTEAEAA